ncbi:ABC transporter, ATP-binding domain protein [Mycobacterium ulcerans str. Harvey]|uniref:ABC transporter, ATP-binding domain protein n=1 Tax=Mycobacterium ulcerans str. Harvey TaxID=1299332 RepID=A0ABP3ANF7_MYCUL|nr:ABC transporter, ATP-binding domain protein [Mycobacterium ulcerans str. Harvey]
MTHNRAAADVADPIIQMRDGAIVEQRRNSARPRQAACGGD